MRTRTPADATTGAPDRGRFARTIVALELSLAVAALGGAVSLAASPHDAMPAGYLARTPFSTWLWPGVLLGSTVAVPAAAVAFAALRRKTWAHVGHPLVGLILVGWIVVQLAVLGFISWLQPAMFLWGLVIVAFGAADYRDGPGGA